MQPVLFPILTAWMTIESIQQTNLLCSFPADSENVADTPLPFEIHLIHQLILTLPQQHIIHIHQLVKNKSDKATSSKCALAQWSAQISKCKCTQFVL